MKITKEKAVTIITESLIEKKLIRELKKLGINGYTIEDVRGEGQKGERGSDWDQMSSVRIQIVCDKILADKILNYLYKNYLDKYAMFVFMFDTETIYSDNK
ncbi:MAG TPA: transcriptional regulator [Ignavibacteria bacterium]|nr:transcriptional regulator [Ignavibacteria bacterium]HMR41785.1 transcriptional regulator [Ignavibacteria bacterium]